MFAGAIGVGGPISFGFFKRGLRSMEAYFFPVGQLYRLAIARDLARSFLDQDFVLVGLWDRCAPGRPIRAPTRRLRPATITWDFDPWLYVAVDRSTVPVLTATATLVCADRSPSSLR